MEQKMRELFALLIIFILVVLGCGTPYKKKGLSGGYSDYRLASDTFSVTFKGNAYISGDKVEQYALRRCAELTLENGFKYFIELGSKDFSKTMMYHSSSGSAQAYGNGTYAQAYGSGTGFSMPMTKPAISIRIKCFEEGKQPEGAINAQEFLDYNFPKKEQKTSE